MREIALATGVKNKDIIEFIETNIRSKIDFCKTIITNYTDNNFRYLLFACDQQYIEPCESILREIIVDYIESVYKMGYLKSKIKNPMTDSLTFNAYIKVLSVFDRATDESALKKILSFNQTLFIDSFLEFRLSPLRLHWDSLVNISCDNMSLFSSGTFVDVIKFLLNTMDAGCYKLKVVCTNDIFNVYHIAKKNDGIKKVATCDNASDLISKVLNECPIYVDVYMSGDSDNEAVRFLSNVFANRMKIFTKNSSNS